MKTLQQYMIELGVILDDNFGYIPEKLKKVIVTKLAEYVYGAVCEKQSYIEQLHRDYGISAIGADEEG